MSSNLKSNWTNSPPNKLWRPHGKKKSIYFLKNNLLSILNMGSKFSSIIWIFWSQWYNRFIIWSYDAKVRTITTVFFLFHCQSALMVVRSMKNMGKINGAWRISGSIIGAWKKCPPPYWISSNLFIYPLTMPFYQGVDFSLN
jgi:hypothetical protein